ncbi:MULTISPECIES: type III glutamate--ammonia ligase [Methylobacillus]|uniref:L-glutamine synthetase n=1 Tax=Methylobacillus flagellatus (strain ATCC 51484 / DSM 6875 / VKM B-1610 / KT) TaxID=265072 RepID=Q1GY60_METFK|nr:MULTISPECIES: type III glutamate--ammonia ligase [Methylobacillus]ABE50827.1 L-glutamine synthetase [Methylobacillus flagellatus KT]MPS47579.1 type III glutamate--ammonia ligase [Methylobacillus sp.]
MKAGTQKTLTHSDLVEQGVRFLLASYVDLHGVPKAKAVPISHFDRMMNGSEMFTGAALDGVPQEISDEEVAAHPDMGSAIVLPWSKDIAWLPSDLYTQGEPFNACSRTILKKVRQQAAELGMAMQLGIEAEFFVLKDQEAGGFSPISTRHHLKKPAYDVARLLDNKPWLSELVEAMDSLDWGVYSFDHEDGIGQFEIDFSYFEVLRMADNFTFLRMMANEIARKHGGFASFMPKPYGDRAGSGAHFNISLTDINTGLNLFEPEQDDPRGCGLSTLGYQFIAGVLRHLPAICAVVAPTVNSYKRLVKQGSMSGFTWAPVFCCYGNNNRTNTIRIPLGGKRIEIRAVDSACNPYLGAAMILAAGLEGIRENLDPGDPHLDNMYEKTPEELASLGIRELPKTLEEAIDAFEADPLSRQVFGDQMFSAWTQYKREEWLSYITHVSDWEYDRYLKLF